MSSSASGTILTSKAAGFTEETFKSFLRDRDEPSWLTERRREAFARFQASAWPSARDEEWRRTDIRGFKLDGFSPPRREQPSGAARESFDDQWTALCLHYATGIEHINGSLVREPDPSRLGGAVFVDLNRAVKDYPELVKRYLLTEAVTPADDVFAALHSAFWTSGTLLLRA